ncbi:MAG: hypothetical protein Q4B70_09005 [Lachnospiraceae bacterium]|nr:hypothetical protein [Lachnospiraceae bacterium]
MRKKAFCLGAGVLLTMLLVTGCNHELTQEEVESSKYYQKLETTNQEQKKQIKELENEVNELSKSLVKEQKAATTSNTETGNKKAEDYFENLKAASLIEVEVGYTDDYCDPVHISDKGLFPLALSLADDADLSAKYTPEELREKFEIGYSYTFYDEDDTVFQIEVYGDGYVIFADLPAQVYYCPDSFLFGQAYLVRRGDYPNSKLLHRMADSAIILESEKAAWTRDTCLAVANSIDAMDKKKIKKEADKETNPKKEYSIYSYGNRMVLTLYKTQICIANWDGEETWYQVTEEQMKELNAVFD